MILKTNAMIMDPWNKNNRDSFYEFWHWSSIIGKNKRYTIFTHLRGEYWSWWSKYEGRSNHWIGKSINCSRNWSRGI